MSSQAAVALGVGEVAGESPLAVPGRAAGFACGHGAHASMMARRVRGVFRAPRQVPVSPESGAFVIRRGLAHALDLVVYELL
jgi:hypothetical protein